jgi:hypothetical protein
VTDLLVVSPGTTGGLRLADVQLVEMLREAGAAVDAVTTRIGTTNALGRASPVNEVVEAVASRRALATGLRRHRPRAVVFSTTTAALFAGDPGVPFAVWLEAPGAPQPRVGQRRRPVFGHHHAVRVGGSQRPLEPVRPQQRRPAGSAALPRAQVHERVRVLGREPVGRYVPARLAGRW